MSSIPASVLPRPGAASSPMERVRQERRFFRGMAIALAVVCFLGFAPSYYLKSQFGTPELGPLVHMHGFAFTLWIALLVTQASLVSAGRVQWHRQLGIAGAVLLATMVVLGAATAVARGKVPIPGMPHEALLGFLAIPFVSLLVFPTLMGTGIYLRKAPDFHKRLLMLGTIEIVTAAVDRLVGFITFIPRTPPVFFALTDLFVLALVVYDVRTRGRIHPATLWGGLFLIASQPLRLLLGGSSAWMSFAHWVTGT